jgi:hypothetical protein
MICKPCAQPPGGMIKTPLSYETGSVKTWFDVLPLTSVMGVIDTA